MNRASVTVVGSDHPHGIFEFAGVAEVTVNEDRGQVGDLDSFQLLKVIKDFFVGAILN